MWIFFVTDAVLLGAAAFIARESPQPLSTTAVLSIVACTIAGGIVALVPLVARFERQKNETLDDRQRALEALARTVAASAEQISIAAGGLHEIAELAQKNLRQGEQLPHKLQEKIAAFQAQLSAAEDTEKEELEKELLSLRSSESERLEAVSTRIAKTAAELAKLEAATQQHLTAANEAMSKLALGTASAIGKAQAAAEQALAQARTEAARGLGETSGAATREIESAKLAALAEIDARLTEWLRRLARDLPPVATPPPSAAEQTPASAAPEASAPVATAATDAPKAESTAHPPKRPRKPRREDTEIAAAAIVELPTVTEASTAEPAAESVAPVPIATPAAEPAPVPLEKIPEIAPVVPHTPEPFPAASALSAPAPAPDAPPPADAPAVAPEAELPKPPRKRAAKKAPEETATPLPISSAESSAPRDELDLGIQDSPPPATGERVLSSDGATRLLVTAYIGIGNRLFIRGAGPGLTWEKGVPLQFVSIGKWRWETNDATAPVQFKLFKNDTAECTALGEQALDPGYQQEVNATF